MSKHAMDRYELKNLIEKLDQIRGRNTELVSLYVPAGYDINKIVEFLTIEVSEAENIKSKTTRKNVQAALDKIKRRLKDVGQTPENGFAIFAGNVAEQEGKQDIQMWEVVPPEPVDSRRYRCDKSFVLDPLRDLVVEKDIYGLIVVDKSDAAIGYLKGNTLIIRKELESNVPGKTTKGGQSQQRFERIRESMYDTFLKQVADAAQQEFLPKARKNELLGVLVGGPGFAKDDLLDKDYLHNELQERVLARKGTNYSGEEGLHELMNKCQDLIEESRAIEEQKLVQQFLTNLKEDNGLSTYGLHEVARALQMGAVDHVLVSEDFDMVEVTYDCNEETLTEQVHADEIDDLDCPNNASPDIQSKRDVVEILKEKAAQMDSDLTIISKESKEGKRLKNLGGIAALLRYRIS